MTDQDIAELIPELRKWPRTAKLAHEFPALQAIGDTITVSEGDYWLFVTSASEAASALETERARLDEAVKALTGAERALGNLLVIAKSGAELWVADAEAVLESVRAAIRSRTSPKETDNG